MSRKLQFNISDGVNLSVNEEDNTANLWTEATYNDFGVYSPVFYNNNLYLNITGTFVLPSSTNPITTPENDSTNWVILGSGQHVRDITVDTATGVITVTYTDSSTALTFQTGHGIVNGLDTEFTYRDKLQFKGNANVVDDSSNGRTVIYDQYIENAESIATGDAGQVIDNGVGGLDGNQALIGIRNLSNADGNIQFTTNGNVNEIDSIEITHNTGNTETNAVEIAKLKAEVGHNSLEDLSDVDVDSATIANGDVLRRFLKTAFFDFHFDDVTDTASVILEDTNGILITSTGVNTQQIDIQLVVGQASQTVDYDFDGNGLVLTMHLNFVEAVEAITIDDITDLLYSSLSSTNQTANATSINFDRGDGTAPTYTRTDGGLTYTISTGFTLEADSTYNAGTKASGSVTFTDLRGNPSTTAWTSVRIDVSGVNGHSLVLRPPQIITGLNNYISRVADLFNANNIFNQLFTATASNGTLTFDALKVGTAYNASISFKFADTDRQDNPSSDIDPAFGGISMTGGTDPTTARLLRWTDTVADRKIIPMTIEGDGLFDFENGGNDWRNQSLANVTPEFGITLGVNFNVTYIANTTNNWTNYAGTGRFKVFDSETVTGDAFRSGGATMFQTDGAGTAIFERIDADGNDVTTILEDLVNTNILNITLPNGSTVVMDTFTAVDPADYAPNADVDEYRCFRAAWTVTGGAWTVVNESAMEIEITEDLPIAGQVFVRGQHALEGDNEYLMFNTAGKTTAAIAGDFPSADTAHWKALTS